MSEMSPEAINRAIEDLKFERRQAERKSDVDRVAVLDAALKKVEAEATREVLRPCSSM